MVAFKKKTDLHGWFEKQLFEFFSVGNYCKTDKTIIFVLDERYKIFGSRFRRAACRLPTRFARDVGGTSTRVKTTRNSFLYFFVGIISPYKTPL